MQCTSHSLAQSGKRDTGLPSQVIPALVHTAREGAERILGVQWPGVQTIYEHAVTGQG